MLARACEIKIQCKDEDLEIISSTLPCEIKRFPCTYLGLPLAIRKPSKAELLPLIDKVANGLPSWKASLMNRAYGAHLYPIYLVIALDLPKWVFKAIDGAFLGKAMIRLMVGSPNPMIVAAENRRLMAMGWITHPGPTKR